MKKMMDKKWLEPALRWIVGICFVYASFHKIGDPAGFAKIIYGYGLFPHETINILAIVVPFLELVAGLALLSGIHARGAAALIGGMLFLFSCAILINIIRGHEFDCGCFTFAEKKSILHSAESLLVRDMLMLVMCVYLVKAGKGQRAPEQVSG